MRLEPVRIGALLLLRGASEVEIRPQTPILQGPDLIEQQGGDATSGIADGGFGHGEILHRDAKENRGSASVVFAYAVCDMPDLGPQSQFGFIDRLLESVLMYEADRNVRHFSIIFNRARQRWLVTRKGSTFDDLSINVKKARYRNPAPLTTPVPTRMASYFAAAFEPSPQKAGPLIEGYSVTALAAAVRLS